MFLFSYHHIPYTALYSNYLPIKHDGAANTNILRLYYSWSQI